MIKTKKAALLPILPVLLLGLFASALIMLFNTRVSASGVKGNAVIGDYDDRLTDGQEKELLSLMETAAEKTGLKIGIVITGDLEGKSDERFTDNFGFSAFGDTDWVVLMLFNSYDKAEYANYTDVISRNRAADDRLKRFDVQMLDNIYDVLELNAYKDYGSDDIYHLFNYYGGCKAFISDVQKLGSDSIATRLLMLVQYHLGQILLGAVIAAVITLIIVSSVTRSYKKIKPISAANYIDQSRTRITRQVDQFVREYTTSVSRSSSSHGGHGGGGGGHHSSSHGHHR